MTSIKTILMVSTVWVALSACDLIKAPHSETLSARFDHAGFTSNCISCHISARPAPINGVIHGNGADCAACHVPSSWKNVTGFDHNPKPTSCNSCHDAIRPAPVAGVVHGNGLDCVSCHTTTSWSATITFNHSPLPTSCSVCHETNRPTTTTYPQSNSIVAGHYNVKDCYSCHQTTVVTPAWNNFAHKQANGSGVSFCLPCHLAEGQRKHSGKNYFSGDGTCQTCHSYGKGWDN